MEAISVYPKFKQKKNKLQSKIQMNSQTKLNEIFFIQFKLMLLGTKTKQKKKKENQK